jgi:hypothetical protein
VTTTTVRPLTRAITAGLGAALQHEVGFTLTDDAATFDGEPEVVRGKLNAAYVRLARQQGPHTGPMLALGQTILKIKNGNVEVES